jgi:hypothetical protein
LIGVGAVLVCVAAVAAVGIALALPDAAEPRADERHLRPLPEGPPTRQPASALLLRKTLDDMIGEAEVVFVGRVRAIGGSEAFIPPHEVAGPDGDTRAIPAHTFHRLRFEVMEFLRSSRGLRHVLDISELDDDSAAGVREGQSYLVFAKWTTLGGDAGIPALVPVGYHQGVYAMVDGDTARNSMNGTVNVAMIKTRLSDDPN